MGNYNFDVDLAEGIRLEKKFIQFLKSKNKKILSYKHSSTKEKDLTVEFDYGIQTFEVKSDEYSLDYPIYFRNTVIEPDGFGTLFIECESWGKYSGIITTKADWWVHFLKRMDQIWMIETKILKEIIHTQPFDLMENAGDPGSNTKGLLLPREHFKKFFKIYYYE
jgi:hypothetical protein